MIAPVAARPARCCAGRGRSASSARRSPSPATSRARRRRCRSRSTTRWRPIPKAAIALSLVLLVVSVVVLVALRDRWLRGGSISVTAGSAGLVVDAAVRRGTFTPRGQPDRGPGRGAGRAGPERRRQDHAAARAGRARSGDRPGASRWTGRSWTTPARASSWRPAAADRLRLPELPALPASDRARQRGVLAARPRPGPAGGPVSRSALAGPARLADLADRKPRPAVRRPGAAGRAGPGAGW